MAHSPVVRRYLLRMAGTSLLYIVAVFLSFHVLYHGRLPLPAALGLALIPSIPLILMIVVVALYLKEEKDDFQRELFIRALLWGTGVTLALTSFWSFVHLFAHFPPVDGFHVFVLFWVVDGVAALVLRLRNGVSNE
jgi:hypothetical protein